MSSKLGNLDFPAGTVDRNLHVSVGVMGSIPGLGKISRAVEHLSPRATTTEPEKPQQWEASTPQLEKAPVHHN